MPFGNTGSGIPIGQKGAPNGVATLNELGKVPGSQIGAPLGVSQFVADFAALADLYCPLAGQLRSFDVGLFPSPALGTLWAGLQAVVSPTVVPGGAVTNRAVPTRGQPLTCAAISNPVTEDWGVIFDAILPAPATGHVSALGISEQAVAGDFGGQHVGLFSNYDLSVDARTHIFLEAYDGVSYTRANLAGLPSGRHRFGLFKSAAGLRVTVDGALSVSVADLSHVPAVACGFSLWGTVANDVFLSRYATRTLI